MASSLRRAAAAAADGRAACVCGARRRRQRRAREGQSRSRNVSLAATSSATESRRRRDRAATPTLPDFNEAALLRFVTSRGGVVPAGLRVRDKSRDDAGRVHTSCLYYLAAPAEDSAEAGVRIRVPRECWLDASCRGWRHAALLASAKGGAASRPWVALALRLLDEVRLGCTSEYAPFLATLRFVETLAPCWAPLLADSDDTDGGKLAGLQMVQGCHEYDAFVSAVWRELADTQGVVGAHRDAFPAEHFNDALFAWAFAVLRARTFAPLQADTIALVPLVDLAVHNAAASGWQRRRAGLLSGSEAIELALTRAEPISVDNSAEVPMSFDAGAPARLTTSQLALDYGVVEDVARQLAWLTLGLDEEDVYFDDKLDVLEAEGLDSSASFVLGGGGGGVDDAPPDGMLAYLRLMSLSGADAFLLEPIFRDELWSFLQQPVSEANETDVCAGVVQGCKEVLACIPKLAPGGTLSVAADAERRAITSTLFWFESQASMVSRNQLEYYQERRLKSLKLLDTEGKSTYDPFDDMNIA